MPQEDIHPRIYMYRRIVEAKRFIDRNYHQKIDLNEISDKAAFSKFHFLRLFKEAFGKSPYQYLTDVRIRHACSHLKQGNSVSDACFDVGFTSITSFTRLFKEHTGWSPANFRKYQLRLQEKSRTEPLSFVPYCFIEKAGLA